MLICDLVSFEWIIISETSILLGSIGLYTSKNFTEFDKFFHLKGQNKLLDELRVNAR